MCVYSMVTEHYIDRWGRMVPYYPAPYYPQPLQPWEVPPPVTAPLTDEEKAKELQQFKDLIERAKKYDTEHNEPECELDSKKAALKAIADQLGIEISFP